MYRWFGVANADLAQRYGEHSRRHQRIIGASCARCGKRSLMSFCPKLTAGPCTWPSNGQRHVSIGSGQLSHVVWTARGCLTFVKRSRLHCRSRRLFMGANITYGPNTDGIKANSCGSCGALTRIVAPLPLRSTGKITCRCMIVALTGTPTDVHMNVVLVMRIVRVV